MDELGLVEAALNNLLKRDLFWTAPSIAYLRKSPEERAKWWYLAKVQAKKGAPAMVILQQEFIKQRLKS